MWLIVMLARVKRLAKDTSAVKCLTLRLKPRTTKATLLARLRCYETNVQGGKLILSNLEKYQMQNYIGCLKNATLKANLSKHCFWSSWGCSSS